MDVKCPACKSSFTVVTKKYFHRQPDRQGNKVVICPNCRYKANFNKVFRTIE